MVMKLFFVAFCKRAQNIDVSIMANYSLDDEKSRNTGKVFLPEKTPVTPRFPFLFKWKIIVGEPWIYSTHKIQVFGLA